MLVGRVFCGWICPFGTLHHFVAWIMPSKIGRGGSRVDANRTHVYQRTKYYLMYAFLMAAVAGSAIGGMFDPICIAVRSIGLGVIPAAQYLTGRGLSGVQELHSRGLQSAADHSQDFLAHTVWQGHQFYFHQTWIILFLFVAALFANRFIPRFWCRVLCPLGAFLGVFARFAVFGMEKDHAKCTDCNLCLVNCQGADSPQGGVKWRQDECHMCMNCETACPEDVIKFKFLPNRKSAIVKPDTQRRTLLATAAAGAIFIPTARVADSLDVNYHPKVIRPPGAVEERAFLERCIRCAECMKVCPNNALHPAFFEAGVEGMWTPILIARIGYCEHSCVLCGQVCPTGAIQKITEKEKLGQGVPPVKIGTAFYDHGRCLPWAMQTPCIVCEEFCPTSPKAIWVEEVDTEVRDKVAGPNGEQPAMKQVHLQRPHVDPSLCIGCGALRKGLPGPGSAGGVHHECRRDAFEDERDLAREHELQPEELRRAVPARDLRERLSWCTHTMTIPPALCARSTFPKSRLRRSGEGTVSRTSPNLRRFSRTGSCRTRCAASVRSRTPHCTRAVPSSSTASPVGSSSTIST